MSWQPPMTPGAFLSYRVVWHSTFRIKPQAQLMMTAFAPSRFPPREIKRRRGYIWSSTVVYHPPSPWHNFLCLEISTPVVLERHHFFLLPTATTLAPGLKKTYITMTRWATIKIKASNCSERDVSAVIALTELGWKERMKEGGKKSQSKGSKGSSSFFSTLPTDRSPQ